MIEEILVVIGVYITLVKGLIFIHILLNVYEYMMRWFMYLVSDEYSIIERRFLEWINLGIRV
jgi:hypothetical protein